MERKILPIGSVLCDICDRPANVHECITAHGMHRHSACHSALFGGIPVVTTAPHEGTILNMTYGPFTIELSMQYDSAVDDYVVKLTTHTVAISQDSWRRKRGVIYDDMHAYVCTYGDVRKVTPGSVKSKQDCNVTMPKKIIHTLLHNMFPDLASAIGIMPYAH